MQGICFHLTEESLPSFIDFVSSFHQEAKRDDDHVFLPASFRSVRVHLHGVLHLAAVVAALDDDPVHIVDCSGTPECYVGGIFFCDLPIARALLVANKSDYFLSVSVGGDGARESLADFGCPICVEARDPICGFLIYAHKIRRCGSCADTLGPADVHLPWIKHVIARLIFQISWLLIVLGFDQLFADFARWFCLPTQQTTPYIRAMGCYRDFGLQRIRHLDTDESPLTSSIAVYFLDRYVISLDDLNILRDNHDPIIDVIAFSRQLTVIANTDDSDRLTGTVGRRRREAFVSARSALLRTGCTRVRRSFAQDRVKQAVAASREATVATSWV